MHFTDSDIRRITSAAGYFPVAAEGMRGYAAPSLAGDPGFSLVDVLRSADGPAARICKDRPKIRAVCSGGRFFKEYRIRGWWKLFRYRFRTPRPFRALKSALRLREVGIATPEVLLALRGTSCRGVRVDRLVTEALHEEVLFADRLLRERGAAVVDELVDELTPLLAALHAAGLEHGDLNLRNLYRLPAAPETKLRWGVIDLDATRIGKAPVARVRRCRETARLATSIRLALPPEVRDRFPWEELLERCARAYEKHADEMLPRGTLRRAARRLLAHHPMEENAR